MSLGLGLGLCGRRAVSTASAPTVAITSPSAGAAFVRYAGGDTVTVSGTYTGATSVTVSAVVDGVLVSWGAAVLSAGSLALARTVTAADICGPTGSVVLYATAVGPGGTTTSPTVTVRITDPLSRLGGWIDDPDSGIGRPTQFPLTNGDFESGTTGWTAVNCTLTTTAGARTGGAGSLLGLLTPSGTNHYVHQSPGLTVTLRLRIRVWEMAAVGTTHTTGTTVTYNTYDSIAATGAWISRDFYKNVSAGSTSIAFGATSATIPVYLDDLTEEYVALSTWTPATLSTAWASHYWTQSITSRMPWDTETLISGHNAISHNGTSHRLYGSLSAASYAPLHSATGCYLVRALTTGSGTTGVGTVLDSHNNSASTAGISLSYDRVNALAEFKKSNASGTLLVDITAACARSATHVIEAWSSESAGSSIAVDGGTATTAAAYSGSSSASPSGLCLGSTTGAANFFATQMGKGWTLLGVPTASERAAIVSSLKSWAGVS